MKTSKVRGYTPNTGDRVRIVDDRNRYRNGAYIGRTGVAEWRGNRLGIFLDNSIHLSKEEIDQEWCGIQELQKQGLFLGVKFEDMQKFLDTVGCGNDANFKLELISPNDGGLIEISDDFDAPLSDFDEYTQETKE